MLGQRCAIIVVSCDAYSDLWVPFFNVFWKHWPDCPFPVYLTANTKQFAHSKVTMLLSGRESSWGEELKICLRQVKEPELIVMLEDFFLRAPVDTARLLSAMEEWRRLVGKALRLHPRPGPDKKLAGTITFGECTAGAPYRVCLQATLWVRSALLELLAEGETPWAFELSGTVRAAQTESGYYCSYKSLLPYKTHVVEKGEWYFDAARTFRKLDVGCDFNQRRVMSFWTYARIKWGRCWAWPLGLISWQTRLRWRERLRRSPRVESALLTALHLKSPSGRRVISSR